MKKVTVLGAGLAGCECAWQLAKRGIEVRLFEMKPNKMTPAHSSEYFAELVCSNSLRSDELTNAVGLLKAEMRKMGSLIMESADANRVADLNRRCARRAYVLRHGYYHGLRQRHSFNCCFKTWCRRSGWYRSG